MEWVILWESTEKVSGFYFFLFRHYLIITGSFFDFFLNLISIFLFIIIFLSKKLSKVNCQLVISFFSLGKWKSYEAFISDFVLFKKKKYCFSFAAELSMFSNISRGFIFQLIYCPIKNSLHKDFLTIRKEKNDSLRNISGQSFQFNITEICPVWIVSVVIYTYIYIRDQYM